MPSSLALSTVTLIFLELHSGIEVVGTLMYGSTEGPRFDNTLQLQSTIVCQKWAMA